MPQADQGDLERRILERLQQSKRPHLGLARLERMLGSSAGELEPALRTLEASGEILRDSKKRLTLSSRAGLVVGTVRVGRRGRAVLVPDPADAPLWLGRHGTRPALDGDRVLAEPTPYTRRGLRSAKILRVLERRRKLVVGVVSERDPGRLLPSDARLGDYVVVVAGDGASAPPGAMVSARILEYPTSYRDLSVRVEEVLGAVGQLETEIHAVCRSAGIAEEFDAAVEDEAGKLSEPSPSELNERRDLRSLTTFTIDPYDAKDHDDAVAIEAAGDGFRLTVSIADVAHYVRPGSAIDDEAFERATSVYFPGRAVPMLPERLSGELASLHPGVDRLAVSAILDIDAAGKVVAADFARSVIRSVASLSYEQAQAALDGEGGGTRADVVAALGDMRRCAAALLDARLARGAIDLDVPEASIVLDDDGNPTDIRRRPRLFAHRLIEEFMLAANEAVASRLESAGAAFLYRIHEKPDPEALSSLAQRVSVLGLRLKESGERVSPADLQRLLRAAAGRPIARQVNLLVLRSMQRARYSADKEMHFGLASGCYTHFTSPIRRYPDLITHRALLATLGAGGGAVPGKEALRVNALHCSARERRAMDAERDVAAAAAVLYMAPRVGETFAGTVSGVERFGFFVELDEVFVEGFVPVGRLTEYYQYLRERMELQSRSSSHCIRIGDRITVRVTGIDLSARSIEMEPS